MIIPEKLKKGDEIRVVAPSRSLALLSDDIVESAMKRIEKEGYKVTFSKNCREKDISMSSSVESRVKDLHQAFEDRNVKAILTVIGGFNVNQILKYLDYDLIKRNPKILCGYSDITALSNAITAKTGLVTYSGIHFVTWGMKKQFEHNLKYFNKCLVASGEFEIEPSSDWSDDEWYLDQENRKVYPNDGFWAINKGQAQGRILGGNLCTLNLLQGTEFFPDLTDSILFLEDDNIVGEAFVLEFDRNLQSLIQQPGFDKVRGLVIGRFQKNSQMTPEKIKYIIETKKELKNIPIIANVDFGHTSPMITFPIGGEVKISVEDEITSLKITKH